MMMMAATTSRRSGFVLDYTTVVSGFEYTFTNNQTFYISGTAEFSGAVTLGANCVIKFADGANLKCSGMIYCQGTPSAPSIFTSKNEDLFGELITNSTHRATKYAALSLYYPINNLDLSNLRIRWARKAIGLIDENPYQNTFWLRNSVFESCDDGVSTVNSTLLLQSNKVSHVTRPIVPGSSVSGTFTDIGSQDIDGDYLNDGWEYAYFGSLLQPGWSDPDYDGLNNEQEETLEPSGAHPLVSDAPAIQFQPQALTARQGGSATITVQASGPALYYQWYKGGQPIEGATSSTLSLTGVQLADSDYYYAQVRNFCSSVNSSSVFLSVSTGPSAVLPSGCVAWWDAENNPNDQVGTSHGTIYNGGSYVSGKVGQAFNLNGASQHLRIPDRPETRVTNAATFEAWVYPTSSGGQMSIVSKWDAQAGVDKRSFGFVIQGNRTLGIGAAPYGTASGCVGLDSTQQIPLNTWTHVAGTYDGSLFRLFVNGQFDSQFAYTGGFYPGAIDYAIGAVVGGYPEGSCLSPFYGLIDEVSIYNRALSASEIFDIYTAGVYGKVPPAPPTINTQPESKTVLAGTNVAFIVVATGSPPFSYQWLFNGAAIPGATSASHTIANVQPSHAGTYAVVVANGGGSVRSAHAVLTVGAPSCCTLPPGAVGWWTGNNTTADLINGNPAVLTNGTTYTSSGKVAQSFSFDGVDDFAIVHNAAPLNPTTGLTVEAWVYASGSTSQNMALISKDGCYSERQYFLTVSSERHFRAHIGTIYGLYYFDGATTVQPSTWYHVAMTYDGSTLRLYVNGQPDGSRPASGNLVSTSRPVHIGGSTSGDWGDYKFAGRIDEPTIYDRALSQFELQLIVDAGSAGKCPDTDQDGMPDWWEVANGLNPANNDAADDPDGDWLTNLQEFTSSQSYGTNSNPRDWMVVAWGGESSGKCLVPLNLRDVVSVGGGMEFSIALRANGTVETWGSNMRGEKNAPLGLTNCLAVASAPYHSLALKPDRTLAAWGSWWVGSPVGWTNVGLPGGLASVSAISAGADHDLALLQNGSVTSWGYDPNAAYVTVPSSVTSALAVAAGWEHSTALLPNGTVIAWGHNYSSLGWNVTNVPPGLSSVTAIAAGAHHTLALKSDGTVVAWGAGNNPAATNWADKGQSIVPPGLSGVVAISAAGYHCLALKSDGTIVTWGDWGAPQFPLSSVAGIGCGGDHHLVIRTNRLTPLIAEHPVSIFRPPGDTAIFTARGLGLAGVHYQWQFNGVDLPGQTAATLALSNVQLSNEGTYRAVISTGAGSITTSNAALSMLHPPQITSTVPAAPSTNWIFSTTSLRVSATAEAQDVYPISYIWYKDGVPFLTNGVPEALLVPHWTAWWHTNSIDGIYTVRARNAAGLSSESAAWSIQYVSIPQQGTAPAWGGNTSHQSEFPADLTNTLSIAAGDLHSLAATDDGRVVQWGESWASVPENLTNAIAVSAGYRHSLALKSDGTIVAWGQAGQLGNTVPAGLAGVTAIASGSNHNIAILTNGTVRAWGANDLGQTNVPAGLSNVIAVAAGSFHSLALRSNGTVAAWGNNTYGQTSIPASASNVVGVAAGGQHSLALRVDGTVVCWGKNNFGQATPPPGLNNVMAVAAGANHSLALKNDATVVGWGDNSQGQTTVPFVLTNTSIRMIAGGGQHSLSAVFSPAVQYPINGDEDLLLIYNSRSLDSSNVCAYYRLNRPNVSGATVLSVHCAPQFTVNRADYYQNLWPPIAAWLEANPTRRPQYWILFLDVPTRISEHTNEFSYAGATNSVSYDLHLAVRTRPLITHINMRQSDTTNDCIAYIDKLRSLGTPTSLARVLLSANAGGYANTTYVLDNIRTGYADVESWVADAKEGLLHAGVPPSSILYTNGLETVTTNGTNVTYYYPAHLTNAADMAGYICWGDHSKLGHQYAFPNPDTNSIPVRWTGQSGWWVIATVESFNGQPHSGHGDFWMWFSDQAFGGTEYSNTPVGAVTHSDEPIGLGIYSSSYFGMWASGKCLARCAWGSRTTAKFQTVGDPLVAK